MASVSQTRSPLKRSAAALLLLCGVVVCGAGGARVPLKPQEEERLLTRMTGQFVERFRQTLDVGQSMDGMELPGAIRRIRGARVPQFLGVNESVIARVDDATAGRLYVALTNFYYLRSAYAFGVKKGIAPPALPIPPKVRKASQQSRWLRSSLPEFKGDEPEVTTVEELKQYIDDFERVNAIYREYLPARMFASPVYKANVAAFNEQRERPPFEIRQGDEDFRISDATNVYVVRQDIFAVYYVKEGADFRLLYIAIGE
jgi:hypothetical protein